MQTSSIEFALVEKQVVEGLKTGAAVLKELNNEMKLEDVEKLMDDTADAIAYQNEVSEMLNENLTQEDEEEIEAELDRLVEEEAKLGAGGQLERLPNVPTTEPPKVEVKGEFEQGVWPARILFQVLTLLINSQRTRSRRNQRNAMKKTSLPSDHYGPLSFLGNSLSWNSPGNLGSLRHFNLLVYSFTPWTSAQSFAPRHPSCPFRQTG